MGMETSPQVALAKDKIRLLKNLIDLRQRVDIITRNHPELAEDTLRLQRVGIRLVALRCGPDMRNFFDDALHILDKPLFRR
jgi:hypothetical protein